MNLHNPILSILILAGMLMLVACQPNDALPAAEMPVRALQASQKSTIPDEVTYDHTLEAFAAGVTGLSRDSAYRNLIHGMARTGFAEEHAVIVKFLADSLRSGGKSLVSDLTTALDRYFEGYPAHYPAGLKRACAGFSYYDEKAFVQIFVPFWDSARLRDVPVVVVDYGEEEEVVEGLRANASGGFDRVTVDEQYAENHLVWVVSMHESADSDADLARLRQKTVIKRSPLPAGSSDEKNWTSNITESDVSQIYISDKKESWISGRAEISMAGIKFGAPNNANTYCEIGKQVQGMPFAKVSNKDLRTWMTPNVKFATVIGRSHNGPMRTDEGFFVLFWEKDKRRRNQKSVGHLPGQCGSRFFYVSNEPAYGYSCILPYLHIMPMNPPQYTNPIWNRAMPTTPRSVEGFDFWNLSYGENHFTFRYTNL